MQHHIHNNPSYSYGTVVYMMCAYVGFVNQTYILIAPNEQPNEWHNRCKKELYAMYML
jgi:hypothetical protein